MQKTHVILDIAGLLIDFNTRYPDYVRERCREYLATEECLSAAEHAGTQPADHKPVLHLPGHGG